MNNRIKVWALCCNREGSQGVFNLRALSRSKVNLKKILLQSWKTFTHIGIYTGHRQKDGRKLLLYLHSPVHQVLRGRLPATWLAEPQASMPRETAPVLLHRVFLTILRRARSMIWAANNSAHGPKFPWVQQKKSFELHVSRMEQVQGFFFIQSELKCTIFV